MSDEKVEQVRIALVKQAMKLYEQKHNPKKIDSKTGLIKQMTIEDAYNGAMMKEDQLLDAETYHGYGGGTIEKAVWSEKQKRFLHRIGTANFKPLQYFQEFIPMQSDSQLQKQRDPSLEEALEDYKAAIVEFDEADKRYIKAHTRRQESQMLKARALAVYERKLKEEMSK